MKLLRQDLKTNKMTCRTIIGCLYFLLSIEGMICINNPGNEECYTDGNAGGYNGTVSRTRSGLECQRWDKKYPHEHHQNPKQFPEGNLCKAKNYCRDPDNEGYPWCYTMSPDTRWEACDIPVCEEPENIECYKRGKARGYNGTVSRTKSGLECQRWDEKDPHEHHQDPHNFPEGSLCEAKNYCRDPDNTGYPWCYTMSRYLRWEECDIPQCEEKIEYDCYNFTKDENNPYKSDRQKCEIKNMIFPKCGDAPLECNECEHCCQMKGCFTWRSTYYRGSWHRTVSGRQCQHWASLTPHNHLYNSDWNFPYDDSAEAAQNYCRDPSDSGYVWCYTVDPDERWEKCDIPEC